MECLNVQIINDALFEENLESFLITLALSTPNPRINIRQSSLSVFIRDEESKFLEDTFNCANPE